MIRDQTLSVRNAKNKLFSKIKIFYSNNYLEHICNTDFLVFVIVSIAMDGQRKPLFRERSINIHDVDYW